MYDKRPAVRVLKAQRAETRLDVVDIQREGHTVVPWYHKIVIAVGNVVDRELIAVEIPLRIVIPVLYRLIAQIGRSVQMPGLKRDGVALAHRRNIRDGIRAVGCGTRCDGRGDIGRAVRSQARHIPALRTASAENKKAGKLNPDVILSIMQEEKPNQVEQFKIPRR